MTFLLIATPILMLVFLCVVGVVFMAALGMEIVDFFTSDSAEIGSHGGAVLAA